MSEQDSPMRIEARIEERPAFTVVGMVVRTKPGDSAMMQLWMDFDGQQERIEGQTEQGVFYGAMDNYDPETSEFDYLAGVEVKAGQPAPEGMVAWTIPSHTYAVFETTLPQIGATYEYIYGPWMAGADFKHAEAPELEVYGKEFNPQDPSSPMYIYIPVTEK